LRHKRFVPCGMGIDIWGPHSIVQDSELYVEFNLDNSKMTLIRCQVIVISVRNNFVGAEFKVRPDYYPELGFYLLP
jgi:hypothetical protein